MGKFANYPSRQKDIGGRGNHPAHLKRLGGLGIWAFSVFMAAAVLAGTALAATETVTTTLFFNVASNHEMSVTLLGQAATVSAPAGTATSANIEFNSTTGNEGTWLNATITSGGSVQGTAANPIAVIDNTGNINFEFNVSIGVTLGATCWNLTYGTVYTDLPGAAPSNVLDTTEIQIDASFTPAEAVKNMWLWGKPVACTATDDLTRTLTFESTSA